MCLAGGLSPLDGVQPDDLTVEHLVARTRGGGVREVILATNPSLEGEATALYVQRQLAGQPMVVTRIARGIPVGGDLEYADGSHHRAGADRAEGHVRRRTQVAIAAGFLGGHGRWRNRLERANS